jgi:signal peptidase I
MNANCDQTWNLPLASDHICPHLNKGLLIFAAGLVGLLLVFRAHFILSIAKGESMLPGLHSGDLLLVNKLAYGAKDLQRGDIVVAREGNDLIVKRVVGLPGEEVELQQGKLYINQRQRAEKYAVEPGWLSLRKGRLLEDRYALLGDNRSVSRFVFVHAVVSKDQILGKVIRSVRLWPDWLRPRLNEAADTEVAATKVNQSWTLREQALNFAANDLLLIRGK